MKNTSIIRTAYGSDTARMYDQKRFSTPQGRLFHELEEAQLRSALSVLSPGSAVLEVGCGTGRFVEMVLAAGLSYVGIDPSPYMVQIVRDRFRANQQVTVFEGEGASLPFPDHSFDFTYAIRVLNQTESEDYALAMVKEMIRVTRPGGRILIEFCNKWRPQKRGETGIRLSPHAVISTVQLESHNARHSLAGILFLSGTLLNRTPDRFLETFRRVDSLLSHVFPYLAARCYVLAETKNHDT